jgi:hypothetical protein
MNETIFTLPDGYTISCRAEKTRYGFRHLSFLFKDGFQVAKDKACYYNRTWESYEFQTVIRGVLFKYFDEATAGKYEQALHKKASEDIQKQFGMVGAIAKLGELFCDKQEDKNKWKERMLKAGLSGLDFPDDFDSLPEEEKEKRLNKVIDFTSGKEE